MPTYEEDLPDVNPRFDLFARRPFLIYPYTARTNLTDRRASRAWRTLELENEHLKLVVLPDLGGRIYSCVDKATGAEMFYANPSIKFADVAYRGAWVALGVEFNFPVSHNWATVSPVDFGTVRHEDGSASVWVGTIDRPYGMQWRVELTLRPGRSLLEQTTTLYNRSDVRHRFYWWTTASVRAEGDSHILYPMEFSASHHFADVDTWPVDSSGVDLSFPRNHLAGFVSRFVHGSREPFMGVYHPATESGMVHVALHHDMPGKKIWSWGWDDEGKDWRRALSDDQSAYLEVQAGLFRNQETYAFLEPHQLLRFRETYQPVRKIGGYSRANDEGVVHVRRGEGGALQVGLNVTRAVDGGRIVVRDGEATVREEPLRLDPSGAFDRTYADLLAPGPYSVEVRDRTGRVILGHTEGRFDVVPKAEVKTGPQPAHVFPPPEKRSEGDWVELGRHQELNGKLLEAHDAYAAALAAFPDSPELQRAAGRLLVGLKRHAEAVVPLSKAVSRKSNDAEALYYLGLAHAALGETQRARFAWGQAATLPAWRAASLLQLGRLTAREGSGHNSRPDPLQGLRLVQQAIAESPGMIRAGGWRWPCSDARAKPRRRGRAWRTGERSIRRARSCGTRRSCSAPRTRRCGHTSPRPGAGPRAGRGLHGARPLGRRPRAPRAPLSRDRRRGRAGDRPAAGLPAGRLLPRLLRREGRPLRRGRTSPSPRASPPATSSRTVPSLSSSSGGRRRRTRKTPPPTSSSGRSFSPADRPTRLSPSGRGRARSTRGSPSSTATSASPTSTRGAPPRRPCGPSRRG